MVEMEIRELIEACKDENSAARKHLYLCYGPTIKAICMRYIKESNEASDTFHDCFIKLMFSLDKYKFQGSFEGWVKRLAANYCLDKLKKTKRLVYTEQVTDGELEDQNNQTNEGILFEENQEKTEFSAEELNDMILTLPDPYRLVFNMYQLEDFSHLEIAKILKIDEQTSRARLSRAKKKLKVILKEKSQEKLNH